FLAWHHLQSLRERGGLRAAVRLDQREDHIDAPLRQRACLLQHPIRLADAGGETQVHLETPAPRTRHQLQKIVRAGPAAAQGKIPLQSGPAMLIKGKVKRLTIYLGEGDTRHGRPLYQVLVELARKHGLAGATVTRGLMGYGASGQIHSAHLVDVASQLPLKVEVVDSADAIDRILPDVYDLVESGLVELSEVEAVKFTPRLPQASAKEVTHVKLEG